MLVLFNLFIDSNTFSFQSFEPFHAHDCWSSLHSEIDYSEERPTRADSNRVRISNFAR